jgi:predicted transcriptional regulator
VASSKLTTKTVKEEVKAEIARLDRRGYSQTQIARRLRESGVASLSQPMVTYYLRQIRDEYKDVVRAERQAMITEKLEQLREVRAEAWDAWERSKGNTRKRVVEKAPVKDNEGEDPPSRMKTSRGSKAAKRPELQVEEVMRRIRVVVTTEGRLPASEYLQIVKQTVELEMKLLGLLEDKTVNNTQNVLMINWDALVAPTPITDPVDEILATKITVPALSSHQEGT